MIVNRCLLYVFVRVELRFPLYLPPTAVLGTAFAIFPICRLSLRYTCDRISFFSHLQIIPALYLWPHSHFFSFADYPCAILVTAFPFFRICRLSPALYLWPHSQFFLFEDYLLCHICDRICNFSHLQIISALYLWLHLHFFSFVDYLRSILVTAFALFSICRLSSPPNQWLHSQLFSFVDYLCSILVTAFAFFLICRLIFTPDETTPPPCTSYPTTVSGDAYRQDYPVYGQWILARLASRDAG